MKVIPMPKLLYWPKFLKKKTFLISILTWSICSTKSVGECCMGVWLFFI